MDISSSSDYDPDELIEYKPCSTDSEANEYGTEHASPGGVPSETDTDTDAIQCKLCLTEVANMSELICHFLLQHETTDNGNASIEQITRRQAKAIGRTVRQKFLCGLCGVESFDTLRETKRHMFEEHGHEDEDGRDSGADYSSEESHHSTDVTLANVGTVSDNDSIDGVSSGMLSGMSSSTQYVSSPDSRRTQRRSCSSYSSSECDLVKKRRPNEPAEFTDYLRTVTLKSLMETFKSEVHYKCTRKGCQYKFVTADVREQHLRCHTTEEEDIGPDPVKHAGNRRRRFTFKCTQTQCDERFDSWKPCLQHLWNVHRVDLGMLRCTLCEKRFGYVVHVFNHLQTHRPKAMREIECRVCGQRFANTAQRSVHEALHRKKGHCPALQLRLRLPLEAVREEEQELTDECGTVERKSYLGKPSRTVGEVKAKPAASRKSASSQSGRRCKLCKRMFSNTKILSKHVKTVHFKIKPFICNVCGYKCARKVTLTIHMRQHSGVKPLACQSCSFRTADPSALYYHERRHREDKSHRCRICGLTTVQPSVLKRHIQSHHPQEYDRIRCRLCSYASINPQNLRRHQADHEAGLIVGSQGGGSERPSSPDAAAHGRIGGGRMGTASVKHVPEVSLDCFLPPESVDSVVHDAGGITIPAVDCSLDGAGAGGGGGGGSGGGGTVVSVGHSEDTQFPL